MQVPRLLLVDDDESNRLTLSGLLELEGFDVETAASASEARARFERLPEPALVMLDQHLGDGLGSDLVPLVHSRFPEAKVLLMSGSLRRDEAIPAAVDAYFTKGESLIDLLTIVNHLLGSTP